LWREHCRCRARPLRLSSITNMGNQKSRELQNEVSRLEKSLSPEEIERVRVQFKEVAGMSGKHDRVAKTDFLKWHRMKDEFWKEKLFEAFDYKDSGCIDYKEFLVSVMAFTKHTSEETQLKFIFSMFASGEMTISRDSLQDLLLHIPDHVIDACGSYGGMVEEAFGNQDEVDGEIGFKEFYEWIQKYHTVADWVRQLNPPSMDIEAANATRRKTMTDQKDFGDAMADMDRGFAPLNTEIIRLEEEYESVRRDLRVEAKLYDQTQARIQKRKAVRSFLKLGHHIQRQVLRHAFGQWSKRVYKAASQDFIKMRQEYLTQATFPNLSERQFPHGFGEFWEKTEDGKWACNKWAPPTSSTGWTTEMESEAMLVTSMTRAQRRKMRENMHRANLFGRFLVRTGRAFPRIYRCQTNKDFPVFNLPSHTSSKTDNETLPHYQTKNMGLFGSIRRQTVALKLRESRDCLAATYMPKRALCSPFPPPARAVQHHCTITFDDAIVADANEVDESVRAAKLAKQLNIDMYQTTLVPVYDVLRWKFVVGSLVDVDVPVDTYAIAEEFERVIGLIVVDYCAKFNEDHDETRGKGHDSGVHADLLIDKPNVDMCENFLALARQNEDNLEFQLNGPLHGFQALSDMLSAPWQAKFAKMNLDPISTFPNTMLLTIVAATLSGPRSKGIAVEKQLVIDRLTGKDSGVNVNVQAPAEEKDMLLLLKKMLCAKLALMVLDGGTINYEGVNDTKIDNPSQKHRLDLLSAIINHSVMSDLQPMFEHAQFRDQYRKARIVKVYRSAQSSPTPISLALGGKALFDEENSTERQLKRHSVTSDVVRDGTLADLQSPTLGEWVYEVVYESNCNVWGSRDPRINKVAYDRLTPRRKDLIDEHFDKTTQSTVKRVSTSMDPRTTSEDRTRIIASVFGSKRQLLRSAIDRWQMGVGTPCHSFKEKFQKCQDESIVRRLNRFQRYSSTSPPNSPEKSPKKKTLDILCYLNVPVPSGWSVTDARKMFLDIYVSNEYRDEYDEEFFLKLGNEEDRAHIDTLPFFKRKVIMDERESERAQKQKAWDKKRRLKGLPRKSAGLYGMGDTRTIVNALGKIDLELSSVLLPRLNLWTDRAEGAMDLEKDLEKMVTKQTQLLNSRLPGATGVVDRLDFAESLTLDVLEENMKEIRAECDKVAKQQEYWRQKVIAYQLKLDQMTSREKGVSFHELVARDAGQATDTHQELKQTDFSWEITG
jgi:Ca2+-binding EF-hand superfamily protein